MPDDVARRSGALEGLAVRHCRLLLAECLAGSPAAPPRLARAHILQVHPHAEHYQLCMIDTK